MNRKIQVNGINYDVDIAYDGEAVLLLHGFTGSNKTWEKMFRENNGYKLIAPSIIGHGETDPTDDIARYSLENISNDLAHILEQVGVSEVHCVGYSMGGRIAQMFAVMHPEKVKTLTLVSTSTGIEREEDRVLRRESDSKLARKIETEGLTSFVDFWEEIPLFASNETCLSEEEKLKLRSQRLANNPSGLINSLLGTGVGNQPYLMEQLKNVQFPVLLINGELDTKYDKIMSEMAKQIPNAKKITISGCGHTPHLEKFEEFGKIIYKFLKTGCAG